jgi:hypothetical protein
MYYESTVFNKLDQVYRDDAAIRCKTAIKLSGVIYAK